MAEATSVIISALIGAVCGGFVSILGSILIYKNSCKQIFADNVSKSRMNWIVEFRNEVGIIVATLRLLNKLYKNNKYDSAKENNNNDNDIYNKIFEAEKARTILLTRLNCDITKEGNEHNKAFSNLLSELNFMILDTTQNNNQQSTISSTQINNVENIENTIEQIIKYTKKILEFEWQRVKREAKGREQNV